MQKEKVKKGEVTRLAIEDAALDLYMDQGYHATSMRQIADKAGLALGGIYNHFKSKEDIFEAIIIDKHPYKRILPIVLEAQTDDLETFLEHAMQVALKELSGEPYYMKLMMIEMIEFEGKHGASLLKMIAPEILPVFQRLVKSRKDLRVVNPAMLMRSFFGLILSYFLTGMLMSGSILDKLMPKNPADVYIDIFLHGILKEPV